MQFSFFFFSNSANQTLFTIFYPDSTYKVPVPAAYACTDRQELLFTESPTNPTDNGPALIRLTSLIVEAFHTGSPVFSNVLNHCPFGNSMMNTVLWSIFAVGLVVLVLILVYCYCSRCMQNRQYANIP
jgi:hypothetical protein